MPPIEIETVAIDFGTSNTLVCIQDPLTNQPKTLRFPSISRSFFDTAVIPSIVFISHDQTCKYGEEVRSQRLGFMQPQRLFQGFKRELVAEFRSPPTQIDGTVYTAEAIAQIFLQEIWSQILIHYQPQQVIFTAPVGAFESYLGWFRQLAVSLELPPIKIVDESTAAALGYANRANMALGNGSLVLVIDFGGGTLDLSLVRTALTDSLNSELKAEVIAKADAYIGGIDIDIWIGEFLLAQNGLTKSEIAAIGWLNILEIAESMKIQISTAAQVKSSWFDDENFVAYELSLTQADLTDILEHRQLTEQVRQTLDEILVIAYSKGVNKLEIQQVLMVGGSSQIKAIQDLVFSYFGRSRVKIDKPFEAIGHGALSIGKFEAISDYLRHGYAIRLWDNFAKSHYFYTLFAKGTKYPCELKQPLILQVANNSQTELRLDIGELADTAEIEVAYDAQGRMTSTLLQKNSDFRSLIDVRSSRSSLSCKLDPVAELGIDRLEIKFSVNAQRTLSTTVKDLLTQKILINDQAIVQLD